jgi:hypothetical protein
MCFVFQRAGHHGRKRIEHAEKHLRNNLGNPKASLAYFL